MKKILSLYRFVGLISSFKVIVYIILRKVDRRLRSYGVEFYQLSNYIFRQKGSIEKRDKDVSVEFPFLKYRPVFNVRPGSSDAHVMLQIFERLEYQPLVTLIHNFPAVTINTIIDAGANAGFTSVFLNLFFPDAQIVSIEPDPGNFNALKKNLSLNKVSAKALKKALWGEEERVKVTHEFRDHREWSRQVEKIRETDVSEDFIEGVTLESIVDAEQWSGVDILKMDIEGAEQYVFADAIATQRILSKIKFIAIELHDEITFRQQFEAHLRDAGFVFTNTGESLIGVNLKLISR